MQKLVIAIYGEENKGELWKAEDAILMKNTAEQHFDKGKFVIVPDIRDNATTDEDLDEQKLVFQTDFRPILGLLQLYDQ